MKNSLFITNLVDFFRLQKNWPFSLLADVEQFINSDEPVTEIFNVNGFDFKLCRISFFEGVQCYYVEFIGKAL